MNLGPSTVFLVTGGAGFIGSHLVHFLVHEDYVVKVLDNFSTGKPETLAHLKNHPRIRIIEGDIRDPETCQTACQGVHIVLHQAALGSVPRSLKDPLTTHLVNADGMLNMLIAARDQGVQRFVYASSSSVYGDSPHLPKKEGQEGRPLSPYAVTKVINELYGRNFYTVYGLKTIGLRYFNVFGPRQDPTSLYAAVIPLFLDALLKNKKPTIFGDGRQSRDFTYIENVIQANLKACVASEQAWGDVFNIGFGGQTTLQDLYQAASDLLGKDFVLPFYDQPRAGDIRHSHADISKARAILNYNPVVDLKEGLRRSLAWYQDTLT